jgi:chemotaxis protein methyltransferase CheR
MNLPQTLADSTYPALKQYVLEHTGLDYYAPRDEDFATRLGRRLTALRSGNCADYLRRLRDDCAEIDALVGELTIGETYFFRQIEHFDLLRTVILPDLLRTNRETRELRIWSAGCATGAEPYSVAILLAQDFAGVMDDWRVTILGTDINPDFLAQARAGRFSRWALRDVPENILSSYFLRDGNQWILHPAIRDAVSFRYHNLTEYPAHPSTDGLPFDLILCRNVMIYFSADRIRRLAQRFHELLRPGGWLLPGHAEYGLDSFPQFTLLRETSATVYRRIPPAEAPIAPAFEPASTRAVHLLAAGRDNAASRNRRRRRRPRSRGHRPLGRRCRRLRTHSRTRLAQPHRALHARARPRASWPRR